MHSRLLTGWSIEATPARWRELELLPPAGTCVYVPALPGSSAADIAAACWSIRARGCEAVPHLAARAMRSRAELVEWLRRMRDAGAGALLLIAGDCRAPAGPFQDTLAVLDSGLVEQSGFRRVGVAGHPEGQPHASEEKLLAALGRKAAWARETGSEAWIVTQFVFEAAPVAGWYERLRRQGIAMPVRIGLPGPAEPGTLLRYAAQCGVGASARMLVRRPAAVSRLLGRWTPEEMLGELGHGLEEDDALPVAGIHVFPFGGLARSIEFLHALRHHDPGMQRTATSGS